MPRLIGTNHDDFLFARDGRDWVIRGRGGYDEIYDGAGDDRLYGGAGGDSIEALNGGFDRAYGGRGDDRVSVAVGEAWGGVGNDIVGISYGIGVGGSGDDEVGGGGREGLTELFGDEGPGIAQRVAGNDLLGSYIDGNGLTRMTGGLGADTFSITSGLNGIAGTVEIMDFTPGQDHIQASIWRGFYEGEGQSARLFAELDANHNGVLEWSDSVGPDGDWTTNDGSPVYTDGHNMYLGLGFTFAGTSSNDAEDWLIVRGTNQITAADWIMT